MMSSVSSKNVGRRHNVLVIAGHDPTCAAGVVADAQTICAIGAHPVTVISALTDQDTHGVNSFEAVSPKFIVQQLETLMADMEFTAVKLGLLANQEIVNRVAPILQSLDVPIVLDPVFTSGAGDSLADEGLADVLRDVLLPHAAIVTPNLSELFCLAHSEPGSEDAIDSSRDQQDVAAMQLLETGVEHVLLTGAHAKSEDVINRLYPAAKKYVWPRLNGEYHGSGCTLASAIAALLAMGSSLESAVEEAQEFAWRALADAYRVSNGQYIPRRNRR